MANRDLIYHDQHLALRVFFPVLVNDTLDLVSEEVQNLHRVSHTVDTQFCLDSLQLRQDTMILNGVHADVDVLSHLDIVTSAVVGFSNKIVAIDLMHLPDQFTYSSFDALFNALDLRLSDDASTAMVVHLGDAWIIYQ